MGKGTQVNPAFANGERVAKKRRKGLSARSWTTSECQTGHWGDTNLATIVNTISQSIGSGSGTFTGMNKQIFGKTFFTIIQWVGLLLLAACAAPPEAPKKAPEIVVFPAPPDEPRFIFERSLHGSADVVAEDADFKMRQMFTGEAAKGGEGLAKPYAVAVFQGRVFVSDSLQSFVGVFDFPNQRFYRIGTEGQGQLGSPLGLDVDRAGNLYVADATAKAVVVFDKDGKFLRRIGGAKWFTRLVSVTLDPKGDRMYAVDIGGNTSKDHRIRVFNPVSGEHLFDFGTRGDGPGELNFPYDLAVGKDGLLHVMDSGNFRISVFTRDGKYLDSFGKVGKQAGSFARPKEIAADAEGNLYVVDAAFGNFQIFNPDGELLMAIGQHSESDGPAKYMMPSGIHIDEDGRVYVVDQWHRKIDVFRPARLKPEQGYFATRNKPDAVKK